MSGRKRDSNAISDLDISSIRHASEHASTKRYEQHKILPKSYGQGKTSGEFLPEIGLSARQNNLMDGQGGAGQNSYYSSHTNKNRFGRSMNDRGDNMDVQSIRSSDIGLVDEKSASIYSRQSKNFNPFYHPEAPALSHNASSSVIKGAGVLRDERRQKFEEQKKEKEHLKDIVEEWGFQNEETKRMFEARVRKAKAQKTKKKKF